MDLVSLGVFAVLLMLCLIALHVPVGVSMGLVGIVGYAQVAGWHAGLALPGIEFPAAMVSLDLALVPLFMLMGNIASHCRLSADVFRVADAFVGHRRGGLAMATIGTCAIFGSVCGSSLATVATMSRIALPPMLRHGYKVELATGSIAAGGSLGMLIPPSIIIVIYAVLTEQLVLTLFVAAIIPGLVAVLFHLVAIAAYVRLVPDAAPVSDRSAWPVRRHAIIRSWGVITLGLIVTVGIYGGFFTVMEAAGVGVVFTLAFAVGRKAINRESIRDVVEETAANTGMIYFVIVGAWILTYVLSASQLPVALFTWIEAQDFSPFVIVLTIYLIYLVLGCIFDSLSALTITMPFVLPIVTNLGYDPVWWGILMIMVIEIGLITPPIGINVFVLKSMSKDIPLKKIFVGILPFLLADLARLAVLTLVPAITLWLPGKLGLL